MKFIVKVALALVLLLCCNLSVTAQTIVTGIVVDKYNNPIPGVRISSKGANNQVSSTVTAMDGTFTLQTTDNSNRITAQYVGFNTINAPLKHEMYLRMKRGDKRYDSKWLLSAQIAIPDIEQVSPAYGLMLGWCNRVGLYAKGMASSHLFNSQDYKEIESIDTNGQSWWQSGKRDASFAAATAGLISKLSRPIYLYLGAGYAMRDTFYYPMTNNRYDYIYSVEDSYKGLAFEAGLILNIDGFSITAGTIWIRNFGFVGNFGIGFAL